MRTRRRPVLQDKTPGNTPQKPKAAAKAKAKLVPVVELSPRLRRSTRARKNVVQEQTDADAAADRAQPEGVKSPIVREARSPEVSEAAKPKRGRPRKGVAKNGRGAAPAVQEEPVEAGRMEVAGNEDVPTVPSPPAEVAAARMLPGPTSPSRRRPRNVPLAPISPRALPVAEPATPRPSTPQSIPIAEDDSTASEAAMAIMNTPSPARIFRPPISLESTPLGKIPPLERSLRPFFPTRRHDSSIRKWNSGVPRAYSPLPPSSPPAPTPTTQMPVASSSQPQPRANRYHFSDEPEEEQENAQVMYARRDPSSDEDPFGLLAVEKKLKAIRQRRMPAESSRAPGAARAPLGTLALDEVPSSIAIPDRIPTPIPSDDDEHNIDDLYLDIDPVRPNQSYMDDSDDLEDEDKENVPTQDYDLNENKENLRPPHIVSDDQENDEPVGDALMDVDAPSRDTDDDENIENIENEVISAAPLLLPSVRRGIDALLASPSSSSASPTHALRTPHKHRSAHKRTPLPTPHFSDGFSDSPLTARSAIQQSSPSPVKPSAARRVPRVPLAPLELEVEMEVDVDGSELTSPPASLPQQEPPKVAGRKRTREQAQGGETSEDSDPRAAVRKLEALLPKRSKAKAKNKAATGKAKAKVRATEATKAARGRPVVRGRGKGKGRENVPEPESPSESDEEEDEVEVESSPPKAPARATRGRGRGRGAAQTTGAGRARGRGRGRGRTTATTTAAAAPRSSPVRGRSTSRGRPVSKGKGKEKAVEEVDPELDEERARQRQQRLEYYRKLQDYSLEKEDVYVI